MPKESEGLTELLTLLEAIKEERKPLTDARIKQTCALLKAIRLEAMKTESLQLVPREVVLWDTIVANYGARCRPSGKAALDVRYRPRGGGRKRNPLPHKLGPWPGVSAEGGRAAARIVSGEVAKGKDPAAQRREERRRSRATLDKLLAEGGPYERHLNERGLVNWKVALSSLRRGLKPHMATDVAELSRNDIVNAIDALTLGAAADLRKFSRSFLEWSEGQGLVRTNVMASWRRPPRTRRQRLQDAEDKGKALSDSEITALWRACAQMQEAGLRGERVSGAFGGLVQLGLLTGMRRGELSQLQRDRHILTGERAVEARSMEGERIHLPKAITKTVADHDIHLTALIAR
jgi:hypothetical protein